MTDLTDDERRVLEHYRQYKQAAFEDVMHGERGSEERFQKMQKMCELTHEVGDIETVFVKAMAKKLEESGALEATLGVEVET